MASANDDRIDESLMIRAADDECGTTVCGSCADAEGCNTSALGSCSHAEGCSSKSIGDCSHAEGYSTRAMESNSHSEGSGTKATGANSHSEGINTSTLADNSHTEGNNTKTIGNSSHAEGVSTSAYADYSHSEGGSTNARGNYSHAEGYATTVNGSYSHAEGYSTVVNSAYSHGEGYGTTVNGSYSHAEGYSTTVNGSISHGEGYGTIVNGTYAHAEGYGSTASGSYSHSEGYQTLTEGYSAHAEGYGTAARAPYSHAEGYYTDTKANQGAQILGIYGEADTPYSWFLGGGSGTGAKALAAKILYTGDGYIRNAWHSGKTGYSEVFCTNCGQAVDPGYFVTLDGVSIRKANAMDRFILGVTSAAPGFVAGDPTLGGNLLTGSWNETVYDDAVISVKTEGEEGKVSEEKQTLKMPLLSKSAVSLTDSGGTPVILLGQVLVYDDGTCVPNQYCLPNNDGVATAASFSVGFRVMKRVSDNQILILFRT